MLVYIKHVKIRDILDKELPSFMLYFIAQFFIYFNPNCRGCTPAGEIPRQARDDGVDEARDDGGCEGILRLTPQNDRGDVQNDRGDV